jgi:F420-0:gamma-glutamyl ligase
MTQEAIADQLATAANMLMGNAAESIPTVIIRDHGIALSDFEGWVPGIEAEEDLFGTL